MKSWPIVANSQYRNDFSYKFYLPDADSDVLVGPPGVEAHPASHDEGEETDDLGRRLEYLFSDLCPRYDLINIMFIQLQGGGDLLLTPSISQENQCSCRVLS